MPNKISLNFNIDGLPIHKSSNHQLWPILCNITEIKNVSPIVVGIYEGKSKPSDLILYLNPFDNHYFDWRAKDDRSYYKSIYM